jgi:hypothetical protein
MKEDTPQDAQMEDAPTSAQVGEAQVEDEIEEDQEEEVEPQRVRIVRNICLRDQ